MTRTERLAKIAGGRAFLDPVALAFMLPLMLASSLLTANYSGNFQALIGWLIANFTAFAVCAVVVFFLIRIPFRNRAIEPIPILLVAAIGALLGLIKGTVTAYVAWRLGFFVDFEQHFISRISQTTLVGLVSIPALAVVGDFRFLYQEERDRLVLHKVRHALEKSDTDDDLTNEEQQAVLIDFITEAKRIVIQGSSIEAASLIRSIIDKNLRPLSHKLWNIESSKIENYDFSALVRFGLKHFPFMVRPLIIVYAPISFLFLLPNYGFLKSLGSTLIVVGAIAVTYAIANLLKPKKSRVTVWLFCLVNGFCTALVMVSPAMAFGQDATTWNARIWLSTFILICEIGFVNSFISAIIANHTVNQRQLDSFANSGAIAADIANRELANFLHGNVQNRLLAIALMIESNHGERAKILSEFERIEDLIHDGFTSQGIFNNSSIAEAFENLRQRWSGFVSIEFKLSGSLEFSGGLGGAIVQLVNEGITNAVRHGLARNIQIYLSQTDKNVEIVVIDDGMGPKQGPKGLGGAYFNSVAKNGWSLKPGDDGGSILTLSLAKR